jgi:hypothetical protein
VRLAIRIARSGSQSQAWSREFPLKRRSGTRACSLLTTGGEKLSPPAATAAPIKCPSPDRRGGRPTERGRPNPRVAPPPAPAETASRPRFPPWASAKPRLPPCFLRCGRPGSDLRQPGTGRFSSAVATRCSLRRAPQAQLSKMRVVLRSLARHGRGRRVERTLLKTAPTWLPRAH